MTWRVLMALALAWSGLVHAAPEDDPPAPHPAQEAESGPGTTAATTTGSSGRVPEDVSPNDGQEQDGQEQERDQSEDSAPTDGP